MKKILASVIAIGMQLSVAQTVPTGNIIAYYAFEDNMKDSSATPHDLKSFSLNTGNDTIYSADQFYDSRIQNQKAYKKHQKIQGCNFPPYCDTLKRLEGAKSPYIPNTSTDGFTVSYWVYNRQAASCNNVQHFNIFDSIATMQYSSLDYSLVSSRSILFGFKYTLCSSGGTAFYTANITNTLGTNKNNLAWKNVVYVFSKTDSTIKSYGNGNYIDTWKLNDYSYNYVFTNPFHIITDQIGGISPQIPDILARAIDDIIVFNKVLSPAEITAVQSYPQAPTTVGINDELLYSQSAVQLEINNGHASFTVANNAQIQSIDIYSIQGHLLASYPKVHQSKYECPTSVFHKGLNIARITLENGSVISTRVPME